MTRIMSNAGRIVGPALGGVLIQWHGVQNAVLSLFWITLALTLLTLCSPSMRYREAFTPATTENPSRVAA